MQGEYLSIETAQKLAKAEKIEKNWNKLKEWLEEQVQRYKNEEEKAYPYFYVWKQMQKLDGDVK